jgi:hypothetical protein
LLIHAFKKTPEIDAIETSSRRLEWSAFALALLSVVLGFLASVPAGLLLAQGGGP